MPCDLLLAFFARGADRPQLQWDTYMVELRLQPRLGI